MRRTLRTPVTVVASLPVLVAVGLRSFNGPAPLFRLSVTLSALSVVALLAHAYLRTTEMTPHRDGDAGSAVRAHILAHAIAFGYLGHTLLAETWPVLADLLWLAPLVYFFHTGRRAWARLHANYGTTLYYAFHRGNSAMRVMVPLLTLAAAILPQAQGFPGRLTTFYFTVHFLLVGVAVLRIDRDISRAKCPP
ncbi:hypothetical protein [Sediminicurvatus halobius]|uniref:Uncharacterized protein n=1 Tax=Sediminicurvatus halobius TaxID=2182432 RepID=A0A2U2N0Y0_9GAMM|nr:hypothetical protein [Spiribacter halobius]PWG62703.1 hypothetical protein DEM34_11165 [Spiribacter halobius]UEX77372.1 hypothetical protein LMH63_15700 [Spiribacter halobius]